MFSLNYLSFLPLETAPFVLALSGLKESPTQISSVLPGSVLFFPSVRKVRNKTLIFVRACRWCVRSRIHLLRPCHLQHVPYIRTRLVKFENKKLTCKLYIYTVKALRSLIEFVQSSNINIGYMLIPTIIISNV